MFEGREFLMMVALIAFASLNIVRGYVQAASLRRVIIELKGWLRQLEADNATQREAIADLIYRDEDLHAEYPEDEKEEEDN